jgi:hypothetical protein
VFACSRPWRGRLRRLFGGGDRDFDDNMFGFEGGIAPTSTPKPPPNRAPDCSGARRTVLELWPPNHQMVPVTIQGGKDLESAPK